MAGMTKAERQAAMADSVEGTETDLPEAAHVPDPVVTRPDPPAPPPTDMQAMIAMLATAIAQGGQLNAEALKDALKGQASSARAPIKESYLDGGFPDQSVYTHPRGAEFNTALRCPMFLGVYDEHGAVTPVFEIYEKVCKETERVLLNTLVPGTTRIERNDGMTAQCRVIEQKDANGGITRLVIAVPVIWLSKDQQAQMPSQIGLLKQLTAQAATVAA